VSLALNLGKEVKKITAWNGKHLSSRFLSAVVIGAAVLSEKMEKHLESCPACKKELDDFEKKFEEYQSSKELCTEDWDAVMDI
jgi:hypothetical protein